MGTALIAMGAADIAFIAIGLVVALVLLAASPLARRRGDPREHAAKSQHRVDVDKQFKRPGNEGDLL